MNCKAHVQADWAKGSASFELYCGLEKGHMGHHEAKIVGIPGTEKVSPWNAKHKIYATMQWHGDSEPAME